MLYRLDRTRRDQEEDKHGEQRDHGPGKFNLVAPVHLRWLIVVGATAPKTDHGVDEETADDHKDASTDPQHQQREFEDGLRRCRNGIKDIRKMYRSVHDASIAARGGRLRAPCL